MAETSDVSASRLPFVGDHAIGRCATRFDALAWCVGFIRDTSAVSDPEVCNRLQEYDHLLGRDQ